MSKSISADDDQDEGSRRRRKDMLKMYYGAEQENAMVFPFVLVKHIQNRIYFNQGKIYFCEKTNLRAN